MKDFCKQKGAATMVVLGKRVDWLLRGYLPLGDPAVRQADYLSSAV